MAKLSTYPAVAQLLDLDGRKVGDVLKKSSITVATIAEREAIPMASRPYGLHVFVESLKRWYRWNQNGSEDGTHDDWVGLMTQAEALTRGNHTGTQPQATVDGLPEALASKARMVPFSHSLYSHAVVDAGDHILALVEKATGRWKLFLTRDSFAAAGDTTSELVPQSPAGVERQVRDRETARFHNMAVRPLRHSRFSHAFVDEAGNVLAYIEKATGKWLIALTADSIIDPTTIVGSARFKPQDPRRSGFLLPFLDENDSLLGGFRTDGTFLSALNERSIVPPSLLAPATAATTALLAGRNVGLPSVRLYYSGDSLTAGAGGQGVSYPAIMAAELGLAFINSAVGGTTSASIGVRQGGLTMLLTLSAALPADTVTEIDVSAWSAEFTNNQGSQSINGIIVAPGGGPNIAVVLRRYSSASPNEATTLKYTLRRRVAGAAIAIPARTRFLSDAANGNELDIHYLQAGQNDPRSTHAQRVVVRDNLLRMVDRIGHDKFGVLGLKYNTIAEASGGSKIAMNDMLEQTFGDHFAKSYRYLGSEMAFLDAGITPTEDDLAFIAAGAVGPSLRSDGVHGNPAYYQLEGKFMARWHRGRGWHSAL